MIKFFKYIFSKRPYKLLGRGGIEFKRADQLFYVDTNNFLGKNNSVEIFYRDIRCLDADMDLPDKDKMDIAGELKKALQKDGGNATIL